MCPSDALDDLPRHFCYPGTLWIAPRTALGLRGFQPGTASRFGGRRWPFLVWMRLILKCNQTITAGDTLGLFPTQNGKPPGKGLGKGLPADLWFVGRSWTSSHFPSRLWLCQANAMGAPPTRRHGLHSQALGAHPTHQPSMHLCLAASDFCPGLAPDSCQLVAVAFF
jgi:hypothetical protein